MHRFIFATNNENKVFEIHSMLNESFKIITLKEAGILIDIPEPHDTLEANAYEKSKTIYNITGEDCFAEDTGLEVECLNGAPGVKSARYAGEGKNFEANIHLLLQNMQGTINRNARFRTVASLIINGKEYKFEGICKGKIIEQRKGEKGFGYDSVFVPEGSDKTFAEMEMEEKNKFSHRKKAIEQMVKFILNKV